ncbi:MAG: hypothetical protein AB7N76_28585 [Planctomycetota bacterium]
MSDARLRELERRYLETRLPEHEVEWLRARVQAGTLAPERLALAALLGGPAALALEDARRGGIDTLWEAWEAGLDAAPAELLGRAFLALGRRLLQGLDPAERSTQGLRADLEALEAAALGLGEPPPLTVLFAGGESEWAAAQSSLLAAYERLFPERTPPLRGMDRATQALNSTVRHARSAALLEVVRAELCPWLLGGEDPLRQRVASRAK